MPSTNQILVCAFSVLSFFCSVRAFPTEPLILSIPTHDIIRNDLSAHEVHPNFALYRTWLESTQGSYIQRDPRAAFAKHPNVVAIECHSDLGTCLLTSRVSFADITESEQDLESLKETLEEQIRARDAEDPAALFKRVVDEHSDIGKRSVLQKRVQDTNTLYSSLHWKTYHYIDAENPSAGYQHYIQWDLKCEKVQLSSSGFQLTTNYGIVGRFQGLTAQLLATLVGDQDPSSTHTVMMSMTFSCGLFSNKCCIKNWYSINYLGGVEQIAPHKEPIECVGGKDVSNQNCNSYNSGWCGMHMVQYQKNEGPGINTENYRFDVILYDNQQELVGEHDLISIPSGQTQQIGSTLPYTFGVTAPNLDDDAVYMSYNMASWGSNDQEHHCNFGPYDSGSRQGDCGFSC